MMDVCSALMPDAQAAQALYPSLGRLGKQMASAEPFTNPHAVRAAMAHRRSQARCGVETYTRSARILPGCLLARPESPFTAGMASTGGIRTLDSKTRVVSAGSRSCLPAVTTLARETNGVCSGACRDQPSLGPARSVERSALTIASVPLGTWPPY